ncbi:sensor histidine kinase [Acinetobacter larvae]|uniref:histidine kinase n=1 Tax=Acinetobacter larvae TaxID=1789224 RepID=A0A1B2M1H8_9GAMM|nr:HAMP domain-containing sensor histidine kinase [Acinetobacter larvae]AOA59056.1 hypothetical protein BFG52_12315 [Acinetobacter larvae]
MTKLPNLRKRIVLTLTIYTVLLTLAVGINGFLVNENIEELVWKTVLNLDFEKMIEAEKKSNSANNSENILFFNEAEGDRIPAEFNQLDIGIHDEIELNNKIYVLKVTQDENHKKIIALDITEIEKHEFKMVMSTLLLTLIAILIIMLITYKQLDKFIDPLLKLADQLLHSSPERNNLPLHSLQGEFYESALLSNALNDYLEKSAHYIKNEKVFFETASHELRTPISALSGAIEVVLQHPETNPEIVTHLKRAARITNEMEELVSMLLFLSRDQQRLANYIEPIDLYTEIPLIIERHDYLCQSKQLKIENQLHQPFLITAPLQLLRVTISNLLRNAIENSDKGKIRIFVDAHHLMIEDPGHGMTAEEISALYTERARQGENHRGGIGLALTLKICEHYGWTLLFESIKHQGTKAILKLK